MRYVVVVQTITLLLQSLDRLSWAVTTVVSVAETAQYDPIKTITQISSCAYLEHFLSFDQAGIVELLGEHNYLLVS